MKNKRVLMTISSANDIHIINKAHEMGVELIIANSYPVESSSTKSAADEAYVVDASDTKAICKLIKEKNIDGVFVTGSDAHLRFYCDICKEAGAYSYCTAAQVNIISDKINFKKYCEKHGLKTIEEYAISDNNEILDKNIKYPVMVKSPDNSGGSKGMTLVYKSEDLPVALEYARNNSPTRSVIVEHYIDGDEFVINYMFVNGKPYVVYTKDYCKNIVDGMVMRDNAMISPSKYEKLFYEKADKKLRKMFADIGMTNGIIFLQCFVEDNELYFFEGGCRAGGADEYFLWSDIYGVDFIKMMLTYSVDGNYGIPNLPEILESTEQNGKYSVLNVLVSGGIIAKIEGLEKVSAMEGVLTSTLLRHIGDEVINDSTSGQIALRIMLKAKDAEDYLKKIDYIYNELSFVSSEGKEMLIPHINLKHWL